MLSTLRRWLAPKPPEPAPPGTDERLEHAENALRKLRRDFDELQAEWESTLSKIGRFMAREAARQRRAIAQAAEAAEAPAAPTDDPHVPLPPGTTHPGQMSKAQLRALVLRRQNGVHRNS